MTLVSEVSSPSLPFLATQEAPSLTAILPRRCMHADLYRWQDGYRFLVDDITVQASPTIKTMLSTGEGGGFAEAESNTARLQIR